MHYRDLGLESSDLGLSTYPYPKIYFVARYDCNENYTETAN